MLPPDLSPLRLPTKPIRRSERHRPRLTLKTALPWHALCDVLLAIVAWTGRQLLAWARRTVHADPCVPVA